MKRSLPILLITALLPLACTADTPALSEPKSPEYLDPTSPLNVVHNLAEAYTHKEADPYARLLAPEFTFRLQPGDADRFHMDALVRNADLAATQGLFAASTVSDIQVVLTHADPDSAGELGFAPGTVKVRINPTFLSVSRYGGVWMVDGDIEDLFFRRGDPGAGEDPDHWFLIEWRDIPSPTAAARPGTSVLADEPVPVIGTTWGRIKLEFLPGAGSAAAGPGRARGRP